MTPLSTDSIAFEEAYRMVAHLRSQLRNAVMGRDDVIDLILVGLLSGGHVLLEDYPGSGKTTLAKTLGGCIEGDEHRADMVSFRRIQFTPDLLPSDVTGVMVFDPSEGKFHLRRGPIFAHIVLVDEINRTSPKVQSALLESMAEKQVTIDNQTHPLDDLFMVIATQNPSDSVGTYPLPQAQLDRFLFKIPMRHIDRESELAVMRTYGHRGHQAEPIAVTRTALLAVREFMENEIHLHENVEHCLLDIASNSRNHPDIALGLSTRTLVQAIAALKAHALIKERRFVSPEDVSCLAAPLFEHRLSIKGGPERTAAVVNELVVGPVDELIKDGLKQ